MLSNSHVYLMIQLKGELLAYLLIIHRLAHARHEFSSWPTHPVLRDIEPSTSM